jgi:DNA-binding MarR family transcriptional regulator
MLLSDVSRLMRRNAMRRLRPLGLTEAQARTLAYLARHEGIKLGCLADILEIQPITLGRSVDKLVDAGLVDRRRDPADRRAVRLHLTTAAGPVLDAMWDKAAGTREDAFMGMAPDRQDAVVDALLTIKNNLLATEAAASAKGTGTDD